MIEKAKVALKELRILEVELEEKKDVLMSSISDKVIGIQSYDNSIQFFNAWEVEEHTGMTVNITETENGETNYYRALAEVKGVKFTAVLDEEEYQEYKKATAPTVADEKL